MPRVAVIGGGLAGLAAAGRLRLLGVTPTVFEQDSIVGGVVRTDVVDGWIIESGPCLAAEPDPAVRILLDAAGLADCTVRAGPLSRNRYIVHSGAPVPLPHTTTDFAASPLLSIAGRLRLLKERFIAAQPEVTEESVDAFARRRFGDEMAERVFDPLLASTSAGDPREVLARYAFPAAVGHERQSGSGLQGNARTRIAARRRAKGQPSGSWSCTGGMAELPRRLAAWAGDVRTGVTVQSIRIAAGHVAVSSVPGGAGSDPFDGVILAVPPGVLGTMSFDFTDAGRLADVAAIPCLSIAAVSLGFRREEVGHPIDAGRLLVPGIEQRSILSAVFPTSLFENHAPDGHVLVTAYVGGARRPDVTDLSESALADLACKDLEPLLDIRAKPQITRVTVWRDVLPQTIAGHARRIAAADTVESTAGPLALTGGWRDGLSVGEVMLGGVRAAERLATRQGWLDFPTSH
ncbi:MAG TPA: protoporphyrinogen oxidase [Gemmatimonadales bacterium]